MSCRAQVVYQLKEGRFSFPISDKGQRNIAVNATRKFPEGFYQVILPFPCGKTGDIYDLEGRMPVIFSDTVKSVEIVPKTIGIDNDFIGLNAEIRNCEVFKK